MKLKTKILIAILLSLTLTAQAANLLSLPEIPNNLFNKPSFFSRVASSVKECTWYLPCYFKPKLGVTITTINATDLISASRATINTNFSNLNDGKVENATTSMSSITTLSGLTTASALATVGTITSGTWTGSVIDVARQGTGTTSPALYRVLLGNAANGITVASSTGTSGQYLTSNGAGAYPSWQSSSVDQAANYTWTGAHQFSGGATSTSFVASSLNASSTSDKPLRLNNVNYNTPSTRAASSTVLKEDGSGALKFQRESWELLNRQTFGAAATNTITFNPRTNVRVIVRSQGSTGETNNYSFKFNGDAGGNYSGISSKDFSSSPTTYVNKTPEAFLFITATTSPFMMVMDIDNATSTKKIANYHINFTDPGIRTGSITWNNTVDQINSIDLLMFRISDGAGGFTWTTGMTAEVYGSNQGGL